MSSILDKRQSVTAMPFEYWCEIGIHQRNQRSGRIDHKEMRAGNGMEPELAIRVTLPFQLALVSNVGICRTANDDDGGMNRRGLPISVVCVDLEVSL